MSKGGFVNYTEDKSIDMANREIEFPVPTKKETENTNVVKKEVASEQVPNSSYTINKVEDRNTNSVSPVDTSGESNTTSTSDIDISEKSENEITKERLYIEKGNQLIEVLKLKYINGQLMYFDNYKYCVATEKFINSVIVQRIYPRATKNFCKNVMFYVDNKLYAENSVNIDSNYINFQNGLYDIENDKLIAHTPEVFTVN